MNTEKRNMEWAPGRRDERGSAGSCEDRHRQDTLDGADQHRR